MAKKTESEQFVGLLIFALIASGIGIFIGLKIGEMNWSFESNLVAASIAAVIMAGIVVFLIKKTA